MNFGENARKQVKKIRNFCHWDFHQTLPEARKNNLYLCVTIKTQVPNLSSVRKYRSQSFFLSINER